MANITVRVPERLLQDVDDRVINSRYKNRSELIRDLLRRYVDGTLYLASVPEKRRV